MRCLRCFTNLDITGRVCGAIRQRYFVVLMCMCGVMLTTINWQSFSFLVTDITYKERNATKNPYLSVCIHSAEDLEGYHRKFGSEEFSWGSQIQGYIYYSWLTGFVLGRLPAGMIVDRFGAKTLFGYSVFVSGICSLVTPLSARTSPYAMMGVRITMGISSAAQLPMMSWFAARWFPAKRTGIMVAFMFLGYPLGFIGKYNLINKVLAYTRYWASVFYVFGAVTIFWVYLWQALVYDDPFDHPFISDKELDWLAAKVHMYATKTELQNGWYWPWKSILTSIPLWSLAIAHTGYTWFMVFMLPITLFNRLYTINFEQHENIAVYLFVMMAVFMVVAGALHDSVISARLFNTTHVTKGYFIISNIFGPVFLLSMSFSSCRLTTLVLYYSGAFICLGFAFCSMTIACLRIAPNFAGTISAFVTCIAESTIPLQLKIINSIAKNGSKQEWRSVAYIIIAVCLLTTALFLKLGNCSTQRWNVPHSKKLDKKLSGKLEPENTGEEKDRPPDATSPAVTWDLPTEESGGKKTEDSVDKQKGGKTPSRKTTPLKKLGRVLKTHGERSNTQVGDV